MQAEIGIRSLLVLDLNASLSLRVGTIAKDGRGGLFEKGAQGWLDVLVRGKQVNSNAASQPLLSMRKPFK